MQGIIASLIITASMWIVGYSAKLILNTIERITGAQIKKGLLSSKELARRLTGIIGKRLDYRFTHFKFKERRY